jgi:hypothetical protein
VDRHRGASVAIELISTNDDFVPVAGRDERLGIAMLVSMTISIFIGPVMSAVLMLCVWHTTLAVNGGNHDRNVQNLGNQGDASARENAGG